jgi:hypothetical protein
MAMCAPDVDTSRQDAIAAQMADMTEEQWGWVKAQYEADKPNREAAVRTAQEVSALQMQQMRKAGSLADESAQQYRTVYRPIEEQAAREAQSFDSEANQQAAAGRAVGDVRQQASVQRGIQERNLASMGINASDGAFASANAEMGNQELLAAASGANAAREQVKTVGRAMRQDAIGVGRGVVGSQGTQAGLTLTAGGQAVGTASAPTTMNNQGIQVMGQANGQAVNGLSQSANIYTNSSRMQMEADAAQSQALAGLAGAGMMAGGYFFGKK